MNMMNAAIDRSLRHQTRTSKCVGLLHWQYRALRVVMAKIPSRGQQEVNS
jgi:hypothetical protein